MEDEFEEPNSLDYDEINKYTAEVVRTILLLDHSKKSFKQSEITACLSRKPGRKIWTTVFQRANERLEKLGLCLRETKNTCPKYYFLCGKEFPLRTMYRQASKSDLADRTLLILVLTFIFMRERAVSDVDILNHLQQCRIYNPNKPVHVYFGDVKKKLFVEFIGQSYLEKVVNKESETVEIKWGERANIEVTKRSVLEFACTLGYQNTIQPKNLISHYAKVLEEEEEGESEENQK